MSDTIDVKATAIVTKGKLFTRPRYTVTLFVDDMSTGIHLHCKKREVTEASQWMVNNTAALLASEGLYEFFADRAEALLPKVATEQKLPAVGDVVSLTTDLGPKYPVGTKGTVVRIDAPEGHSPENVYPVIFAPHGTPGVEIPLAHGEWK